MSMFLHESRYRDLRAVQAQVLTICGAGAVGANLAEALARMGMRSLRVIDRDTIALHNLSTQPWHQADVGVPKVRVLAADLHRAVGLRLDARHQELQPTNAAKLLAGSAVVVDAFDNLAGRQAVATACGQLAIACLHVALGPQGDYGCGFWGASYPALQQQELATSDPCDYPLTRPLALITAHAAAEVLLAWMLTGEQRGFEFTLRDLRMA